MIDKMVSRSRQHLKCLRKILNYLNVYTSQLAYKAFIRPIMKYGNVAIIRIDLMLFRMLPPSLCQTSFVSLRCSRHAAAVGLLLE